MEIGCYFQKTIVLKYFPPKTIRNKGLHLPKFKKNVDFDY